MSYIGKDLKIDCQRQQLDRISSTDMKTKGLAALFGNILGDILGRKVPVSKRTSLMGSCGDPQKMGPSKPIDYASI